jgi:hypothetical protein
VFAIGVLKRRLIALDEPRGEIFGIGWRHPRFALLG